MFLAQDPEVLLADVERVEVGDEARQDPGEEECRVLLQGQAELKEREEGNQVSLPASFSKAKGTSLG